MNWSRWRELGRLHEELGTQELLRKHTLAERLYLVDRLNRVIAVIERGYEAEGEDGDLLVNDGD